MDGIHDLGGMDGFGPIVVDEADEPVFHSRWEGRTFALMLAVMGAGAANLDHARKVIESAPPPDYLRLGYYGRWARALEEILIERGVIDRADVDRAMAGKPRRVRELPDLEPPTDPTSFRSIDTVPEFRVGQRVRAKNLHPKGHTRLPRYVRGRVGTVALCHPAAILPDVHAETGDEHPEHLYAVSFTARELWGEGCEPGVTVRVDLFESYLEGCDGGA